MKPIKKISLNTFARGVNGRSVSLVAELKYTDGLAAERPELHPHVREPTPAPIRIIIPKPISNPCSDTKGNKTLHLT